MFGKAQQVPQTEKTPFCRVVPMVSPKVFSIGATVNIARVRPFREQWILFTPRKPAARRNFSSPQNLARRAAIKHGLQRNCSW